jgi:hypothetical protein
MHRLLTAKRHFSLRRVAFVSCITALATLAWLPANTMARTALGGQVEHLIAYLGTTIVMRMTAEVLPGRPCGEICEDDAVLRSPFIASCGTSPGTVSIRPWG